MPKLSDASQTALRAELLSDMVNPIAVTANPTALIAQNVAKATSTPSTAGQPASPEAEAIGLAVKVLEVGYVLLSEGYAKAKRDRVGFDKERKAGIATFLIPKKVVEMDLSDEQKAIKFFIDAAEKHQSDFIKYLGIKESKLSDSRDKFDSGVIPPRKNGHLAKQLF